MVLGGHRPPSMSLQNGRSWRWWHRLLLSCKLILRVYFILRVPLVKTTFWKFILFWVSIKPFSCLAAIDGHKEEYKSKFPLLIFPLIFFVDVVYLDLPIDVLLLSAYCVGVCVAGFILLLDSIGIIWSNHKFMTLLAFGWVFLLLFFLFLCKQTGTEFHFRFDGM